MLWLLRLHCNNGCTKAPQCYVKPTLPVLLIVMACKILLAVYYDTKFNYSANSARSENKFILYKKIFESMYSVLHNCVNRHFFNVVEPSVTATVGFFFFLPNNDNAQLSGPNMHTVVLPTYDSEKI
jgi:hypothetical protein